MLNIESKKPTLVDLAHYAKVSPVAVSHVGTGKGAIRVSSKTATRIRHLAEELGYVPNKAAQRLREKSGVAGIIANDWMPFGEISGKSTMIKPELIHRESAWIRPCLFESDLIDGCRQNFATDGNPVWNPK